MNRRYFAACTLGLEAVLAQELRDLHALELEVRRGGVAFVGDQKLGYAACLWLRSALRVQEQLLRREISDPRSLYAAVRELDWQDWMRVEHTLAVDASVRDSQITHSQYAALTTKDAIVDQFRDRRGTRPNVDVESPDLPLKLVIKQNIATLYRDLGGESLHKRGYREISVKSPLNEAIAAGLLLLADWDKQSALCDPMCGSGTFAIEAALLATDRAPGLKRRFAFERWPDLDRASWSELRSAARAKVKPELPFPIEAADRHPGALAIARQSAEAAGVADLVRFTQANAGAFVPSVPPRIVVVNPPYGERLGEGDDLYQSWRDLGRFLHTQCKGAQAFVLSGNAELTRHLGLRSSMRWPVMNGPIECRLVRYEIAAATKEEGPSRPT